MYRQLLNSNSSLILEFVPQICHENINKSLDGTYLSDFGIDIKSYYSQVSSVWGPTIT